MIKSRSLAFIPVAALAVTMVLALACASTPAPSSTATAPAPTSTAVPAAAAGTLPVKNWVIATSGEGTRGFAGATLMARVAEKYAQGLKISVKPGFSTTATHQVYDRGEANIAYTDILNMKDVALGTGAFAGNQPKTRVYHSFYHSLSIHNIMTLKKRTDINSYKDLAGKKLFPFTTGSGSQLLASLIFGKDGLNVPVQERQMGVEQIADALNSGVVDAVWVYFTPEGTLTSTWQDLLSRSDVKSVQPSEAEKAVIAKIPGVAAPWMMKAEKIFGAKDVGITDVWGIGVLFGWMMGPREDTERVYQATKAWMEHVDDLIAGDAGYKQVKDYRFKYLEMAIENLPQTPVHPGVAKYMKELGIWKDAWKIGDAPAN